MGVCENLAFLISLGLTLKAEEGGLAGRFDNRTVRQAAQGVLFYLSVLGAGGDTGRVDVINRDERDSGNSGAGATDQSRLLWCDCGFRPVCLIIWSR
jgi:hypothetical protein